LRVIFLPKTLLKEKPEQGIFVLPGGFLLSDDDYSDTSNDAVCEKIVKLRPLTGREEEMIIDANLSTRGNNSGSGIIRLLTDILANCIESIGSINEITPDLVRQLLICDRDYLLLKLRQITFGDQVDAQVKCPNESCKKPMNISFDINSIDIQRKDIGNGKFLMHLSRLAAIKVNNNNGNSRSNNNNHRNNGTYSEIEFRLPTVADQEEIFDVSVENESKALTKMFQRCITHIGDLTEIDENTIYSMSILARREIDRKMQELSPKVDLQLHAKCPECGVDFTSPFDLQNFFLGK
jgi:base plate protein